VVEPIVAGLKSYRHERTVNDSGRLSLELLLQPFDDHLSAIEVRLKSGAVRSVARLVVWRCEESLMFCLKSGVVGQEFAEFTVKCGQHGWGS
jgi:hypothetical protein